MEDCLREKLQTKVLKKFGAAGGGCISTGCGYETDHGRVFVKSNSKPNADIMFNGEFYGLKQIHETNTVRVPKPLATGEIKTKRFIVMEFYEIKSLYKYSSNMGTELAELHLQNIRRLENPGNVIGENDKAIDKFGFHVTTCCGYIPQNNEWSSDWVQFYASQRLLPQIQMIERDKHCREINELWSQLHLKIPAFFKGLDIKPSLLHGDLWSGNAGETDQGAIIFDPAAFYGHHEYDLAIASMFGGFDRNFYKAYHSLIPKQEGFDKRHDLYQLFHYLNHWNHFGSGYQNQSLSIMRSLLK